MQYLKYPQVIVPRLIMAVVLACLMPLGGCGDSKEMPKPPPAPPPVAYKGPRYLLGTVGSMTSLRGYDNELVSGYGLVVDLNGTGAGSCPPFLRQWMLMEMRKGGMGSAKFGTRDLVPEKILSSTSSSVVAIEGIIPPGARRGSRFDVLVSALPGTQTTSLEGGRLYTFNLSANGLNPELRFTRPLAEASGSVYIDPLADPKQSDKHVIQDRRGVILSGGIVSETRQIELSLNQPSWSRSRVIADAINARFMINPAVDREEVAVPVNDSVIRINVPRAFMRDSDKLIKLISKIYVEKSPNFEMTKAEEVGTLLLAEEAKEDAELKADEKARLLTEADRQKLKISLLTDADRQAIRNRTLAVAGDVTLIWIGLGRTALPVISQYYDHPDMDVRLSALSAGVNLHDETTLGDDTSSTRILGMVSSDKPELRAKAAGLLIDLPSSLRGTMALKKLLDDPDKDVRIAAYETLAAVGDPLIQRLSFTEDTVPKFILDLVPSKTPLIYVTQRSFPRVVIFNPLTGFNQPRIAEIWDNRMMLRLEGNDPKSGDPLPAKVFYQTWDQASGTTYEIAPTVANFVFLLGHQPTVEFETKGLNLTYSKVVNALYQLHESGTIASDIQFRLNPLAEAVAKIRVQTDTRQRPETEFSEVDSTQPSSASADEGVRARKPDYTNDNDPGVHSITPAEAWQNSDPSRAPESRPPVMPAP